MELYNVLMFVWLLMYGGIFCWAFYRIYKHRVYYIRPARKDIDLEQLILIVGRDFGKDLY